MIHVGKVLFFKPRRVKFVFHRGGRTLFTRCTRNGTSYPLHISYFDICNKFIFTNFSRLRNNICYNWQSIIYTVYNRFDVQQVTKAYWCRASKTKINRGFPRRLLPPYSCFKDVRIRKTARKAFETKNIIYDLLWTFMCNLNSRKSNHWQSTIS